MKRENRIHAIEAVDPPEPEKPKAPEPAPIDTLRGYYPELSGLQDQTILEAAGLCWKFGLDPTGVGGFARLVAKDARCVFVIGYRGLIGLAMASGSFLAFEARVVYERDTFALDYGMQILKHAPPADGKDAGPIVGAYAFSVETQGSRRLEFIGGVSILAFPTIGLPEAEEVAKKAAVVRLCANSPIEMGALRYALDAEYRLMSGLPIPK